MNIVIGKGSNVYSSINVRLKIHKTIKKII